MEIPQIRTFKNTQMKTLLTLSMAFILILGAFAQDEQTLSKKELRRLQREQKKAEQDAALEKAATITELMVTHQRFVLEADYLSNKTGSRVPVQATINFVMVDSTEGTLQFGSAMAAGYNGVGGATLDGRISNYRYNTTGRNKNSYSIMMNFMSSLGTYDITLMVGADGYADATIRGNWSGTLNYHGRLVPLSQSRVYKGTTTY
jgi:hypothetical protein